MSEEGFAVWLAPFELSKGRLVQCLELGQVALDRRKADAAERKEFFRKIVKEEAESKSAQKPSRIVMPYS